MAFAMAGLASQMCALFAVAVAPGGPRTTPGPANPFISTARAAKTLRGRCAAIWPDLQLEMGRGRAKARRTMLYYGVASPLGGSLMPFYPLLAILTSAAPELDCADEHLRKPFKGPF